jgi:hypothetical protein
MLQMSKMIVRPPDLPATAAAFAACRKSKAGRTFNDRIEDQILSLINGGNVEFLALLNAVQTVDAVEGSITADDFMAAKMIRDYASEHGDSVVAEANLTRIVRAKGVALRRYGLDRTTRRKSVGSISTPTE